MIVGTRELRNALGCFPTGVAIVTARTSDGGAVGMTINSFASVSLDPPLILWSVDRSSDRFSCFAVAESFGINILAAEQKALSQHFARPGCQTLDGVAFTTALTGAPIFEHCHVSFDCRLHSRHDGGDHVILIGEVLALRQHDAVPLVFYRGDYRSLSLEEDLL